MRLENKVAIVVGAGQTPGPTIGNGRATALLFAREGARVLAVDRDGESAAETVEMIAAEGGESFPVVADVTDEASIAAAVRGCVEPWGRIDVLHNNVGIAVNRSLGISRYTMLAIAGFRRTPRSCFAEIGSESIRKQR